MGLAFIILNVAWLIHIYFFLVSWSNDPHNPIPLGYASPSLLSQYLRSILPDCQSVFCGPRAPLHFIVKLSWENIYVPTLTITSGTFLVCRLLILCDIYLALFISYYRVSFSHFL